MYSFVLCNAVLLQFGVLSLNANVSCNSLVLKRIFLLGRALANGSTRQGSSYAVAFKPASMSELPTPAGSWKAHYDANQTRYNMHLLGGIVFAAITVLYGVKSGKVYLSSEVPKLKSA